MPYLALRGVNHYYQWITAGGDDRPWDSPKPVMVFIHGWGGSSRYWEATAQALCGEFDCLLYDLRGFGRSTLGASQLESSPPQSSLEQSNLGQSNLGQSNPELSPQQSSLEKSNLGQSNLGQSNPELSPQRSSLEQSNLEQSNRQLSQQQSNLEQSNLEQSNLEQSNLEQSESLNPYGLPAYSQDLLALLDTLGLERVHLQAHSLGASLALVFLQTYPQRVDRAILACNGLLEYDALAFKLFHIFSRYVVMFRPRWLLDIPQVDRLFMARFLHRSIPANDRRTFLADFLDADFEAALGTAINTVSKTMADLTPQAYAALTVPTLLVSGQYDQIITAPMGAAAAALSPQVTYREMAATGHFPMMEDAPTYLAHVREFLAL
jgi:pimeloyl-ACP methyl ester carboxylesterase